MYNPKRLVTNQPSHVNRHCCYKAQIVSADNHIGTVLQFEINQPLWVSRAENPLVLAFLMLAGSGELTTSPFKVGAPHSTASLSHDSMLLRRFAARLTMLVQETQFSRSSCCVPTLASPLMGDTGLHSQGLLIVRHPNYSVHSCLKHWCKWHKQPLRLLS